MVESGVGKCLIGESAVGVMCLLSLAFCRLILFLSLGLLGRHINIYNSNHIPKVMNTSDRVACLTEHAQEIVSTQELEELFDKKQHPHAYMGFAPTGRMHIGHMAPIRKIVDFLRAGCSFTFLVADLHAYLDDNKSPWELLDARFEAYKQTTIGVLQAFNAPIEKVTFVRGSDFEFEREYQENVLQMIGETTLARAKRSASEVVRFGDAPKLGGFVYPFYQIEDVYALKADIVLGGIDQRGIYMLGRELADKMSRRKYSCVFTPLLPGLTGEKMSSSVEGSKIDLLDDEKTVSQKLQKAFCPAGEVEGNGVISFIEHVVFPMNGSFSISRPEKFGGDVEFGSFEELRDSFVASDIHPLDLKQSLASVLAKWLSVVRENVDDSIIQAAYPE